jgi:hypothetical protein
MPRAKQIKITNGDQEGFCLPESVKAWESAGWTVADDEGSEAEAAEVTEKPLETQAEAAKKTTAKKG